MLSTPWSAIANRSSPYVISTEIGAAGAVIGDLATVSSDSNNSIRDITVEPNGADVNKSLATAQTEATALLKDYNG